MHRTLIISRNSLVRSVMCRAHVRGVYLSGSYAKGNHRASSDVDVHIIVEANKDTYKEVYTKIRLPRLELLMYSIGDYMEMMKKQPEAIKKTTVKNI